MKTPYNIIEVANTHGGDYKYLLGLLNEFEEFHKPNFGVKFQPFKYDSIALKDFSWYSVYEELFFNEKQWTEIIKEAAKTKDVWLDMFDEYSYDILSQNFDQIKGIKLQASVLHNYKLLNLLASLDLSEKSIIINIAGYSTSEIRSTLKQLSDFLPTENIILQIGFQGYPTKLEDSGLVKIESIKNHFPEYRISFTEHLEPEHEMNHFLPLLAVLQGAEIIEKHVKHSLLETKYDAFSSLTASEYKYYVRKTESILRLYEASFITKEELKYLEKSRQIPVLNQDKSAGQLISFAKDLDYKRTDKKGLTVREVLRLIDNFHLIGTAAKANDTLQRSNFKRANIATIIACRMKSSRLAEKAILKIGDLSSIEVCIKNALRFSNTNHTILATSYIDEDAVLENYTYDPSVIFHKGHPDDVIQRYLDVCDKYRIDVVVRVTGDMQYVSDEICDILLKAHFKSGADYTTARKAAIGTNLEIMNVEALWRIKKHFKSADYSEYMTWYFKNNPDHFNLNYVDLPDELIRDYRLTLDYPEDLEMFKAIDKHFSSLGIPEYSLRDIFKFLDEHPEIAELNQDSVVVYHTDQNLIDILNEKTKIW